MRKISDRGRVIAELDKLFRQIILKERGEQCEWCKKHTKVFVSHTLPKGKYPRLRYTKENVLLLCYYCHFHRWHKSPADANEFMESIRGGRYREELLDIERYTDPLNGLKLLALKQQFQAEVK